MTPYHRIRKNRAEGSHPVNKKNAAKSLMRLNKSLIEGDNSDLLLPTNICSMPKEYLAMFYRNESNRHLLTDTIEDEIQRKPKWVIVPHDLNADICLELIELKIFDSFKIRNYIEKYYANLKEGNFTQMEGTNFSGFRK